MVLGCMKFVNCQRPKTICVGIMHWFLPFHACKLTLLNSKARYKSFVMRFSNSFYCPGTRLNLGKHIITLELEYYLCWQLLHVSDGYVWSFSCRFLPECELETFSIQNVNTCLLKIKKVLWNITTYITDLISKFVII